MNQGYPTGFQALGSATLLGTQIDLLADNIKVIAVGAGYIFSAAHQYLSDLGANTIGSAVALATKTVGAGIFGATTTMLSAFPDGQTAVALVIYKDTGVAGTSPLLAYFDTAAGLPFTGTGGDIQLVWDPSNYRIFQY